LFPVIFKIKTHYGSGYWKSKCCCALRFNCCDLALGCCRFNFFWGQLHLPETGQLVISNTMPFLRNVSACNLLGGGGSMNKLWITVVGSRRSEVGNQKSEFECKRIRLL